jgi:hypothetical protein
LPGSHAFVQEPTKTEEHRDDDTRHLRLSSCPQCSGRRRTLVEVGGNLVGRCLGCGEELSVPLETEWESHVVIVGRGGQGIFSADRSSE